MQRIHSLSLSCVAALAPLAGLFLAGQDAPYVAHESSQPGIAARTPQKEQSLPAFRLERVSAAVPWPRGIAWVDGKLFVVARGRHRNYGGPAAEVQDMEATLFEIDPDIREPFEKDVPAGEAVLSNGRVLAAPDPRVVKLFDRSKPPLDNWEMQRPFCTMKYDAQSRNLIFCAYSGVDLSGDGPTFRKNATDALLRYDLRTQAWGVIEQHDPSVVPQAEQKQWISNVYYPHHDPEENPPPHGWLNGPNGCHVVGNWLYAVGKDNHTLARYDLRPIRRDPQAGPPPSEFVLGREIDVRIEGSVQRIPLEGHSAVTSHGGFLYVASRTNSLVVRFPIDASGDMVRPIVGELIAELEPYSTERKRSADLWEMVAGPDGSLVLTASRDGLVWRFHPDPAVVFDGDTRRDGAPSPNKPWIEIRKLTGNDKANVSNVCFAPDGSLYFCMTMPEKDREMAGWILRATPLDG